jgi:hypothetical protein
MAITPRRSALRRDIVQRSRRMVIGVTTVLGFVVVVVGVVHQRRVMLRSRPRSAVAVQATADPASRTLRPVADNANVRSIVEATTSHNHRERLSPLATPSPFDAAAFAANPQAYLDVVEPGRCFRTARKLGPDTPQLKAESPRLRRVGPGEKVPLLVMSAPHAPVTFTAFTGGSFEENGLNSISVQADARGYAVVNFATPPDGRAVLHVLVGSESAVGNVRYVIQPLRAS